MSHAEPRPNRAVALDFSRAGSEMEPSKIAREEGPAYSLHSSPLTFWSERHDIGQW